VLPLYRHFWPAAPTEHIRNLGEAIELAEVTATTGGKKTTARELRTAAITAFAAHAAAVAATDHAWQVIAVAHDAAVVACEHAPSSATAAAESTFWLLSRAATLRTGRIITAPVRDLDRLVRLAEREKWTDDTPVPPEVFGPIWDREPPPWWRDDVLADLPPESETKNPDPANAGSGSS
jgi:hypothetical protein